MFTIARKNADAVVSHDALLREAFTCDMTIQLAEWLLPGHRVMTSKYKF